MGGEVKKVRFEINTLEFVNWVVRATTLDLLQKLDELRESAEHGEAVSMWWKGAIEGEILIRCTSGAVDRDQAGAQILKNPFKDDEEE